VRTVKNPPVARSTTRDVRPGLMRMRDLRRYTAPFRAPTHVDYRQYDVYGMAPPSSGGTTVGEALNILEQFPLRTLTPDKVMHRYLEASALAFADRNRFVGDPSFVDVPVRELLSDAFARERACRIDKQAAAVKPVAPGSPDGTYGGCSAPAQPEQREAQEGLSTTHLTVVDRWGGIVSYTLTIEQTGGSGIVVRDRGFLLNNELTDFNFTPTQGEAFDPNLPGPGKRPRSSMSPTIVFRDGKPFLALGSPGGSTIITTVLQTLVNRIDLGMSLPDAVAAPRATQRNATTVTAEPGFDRETLARLGHEFTDIDELGAVAAIELLRDGRLLAAAEPTRRGGGSAMVVRPSR
jgi:gamma-glutamyltranspeptidase/glutathione hydrolase